MRSAVEFHDAIAKAFGERYRQSPRFAERLDVWSEVIDAIVSRDSIVADLGCGPGNLTVIAASRARRVIAIDGSAEMIREAALVCAAGNVEFRQCMLEDVRATDLPALDVVVCSSVLEYVKDPRALLEECHRALRPGGVVAFSVPNGDSWYRLVEGLCFRLLGRPRYLQYVREVVSGRRERQRFTEAGFEVMEARLFGAAPVLSPLFRWFGARRWSDTLILLVARRP